eukprot:1138369-Pelagomonas_calceolata.AAC.1
MGIWRVTGSAQLQDLAVRSVTEQVYWHDGGQVPVVKLVKVMLNVTIPPKPRRVVYNVTALPLILTWICMLPLCLHVLLICAELMRLSDAGGCVGLVWGAVPAA